MDNLHFDWDFVDDLPPRMHRRKPYGPFPIQQVVASDVGDDAMVVAVGFPKNAVLPLVEVAVVGVGCYGHDDVDGNTSRTTPTVQVSGMDTKVVVAVDGVATVGGGLGVVVPMMTMGHHRLLLT